ncbi:MAG: VOC family protein [Woeseiaceae bacterium]|jgi:predicted enzyme related to lactoylglutathione lyase
MSDNPEVGKIGWIDMSVDDADGVRDFYKAVVGWGSEDVSMGEYSDYSMTLPSTGEAVTGICHALGSNAELPRGWLIYIVVADVEVSATACEQNGGEIIVPPKGLAGGRFCVIRDPAGATAALYQP